MKPSKDPNGDPADVVIQLFGDDGIGESIRSCDSREDTGFDLTNGEFPESSNWNLDWGETYQWRMLMIEKTANKDHGQQVKHT